MARQILKGLTMLMLVIGLALASAVAVNGQANQKLIAQVPFDFIAANKNFRAGEYQVRAVNNAGDVLSIRSADGRNQVLSLSDRTGLAKDQREMKAKLVFHRYGNTYFLSQVWMLGERTGREIRKTRQERAIERELATIASNRNLNEPLYEIVEVMATVR